MALRYSERRARAVDTQTVMLIVIGLAAVTSVVTFLGRKRDPKPVPLTPPSSQEARAKVKAAMEKALGLSPADSVFHEANGLRPDLHDGRGDWAKAAARFDDAARLYEGEDNRDGAADAHHMRGWCLRPDNGPDGNWELALREFEKTAELRAGPQDGAKRADALFQQAVCWWSNEAVEGRSARARALLKEVLDLRRAAGDAQGEGETLFELGLYHLPDRTADGDWAAALAHFQSAEPMLAKAMVGNVEVRIMHAEAVHQQAWCLQPGHHPSGDWAAAHAAYERAAGCFRDAAEAPGRARSLAMQAGCVRPDLNPKGDWRAAARLYGEAAKIGGTTAEDRERTAECLEWQALCQSGGDWEARGDAERTLLRQAIDLYRASGNEARAAELTPLVE